MQVLLRGLDAKVPQQIFNIADVNTFSIGKWNRRGDAKGVRGIVKQQLRTIANTGLARHHAFE